MPKIDEQIAEIEKKMEQHRNRLRDLKAQATKQERKDDTRRKLLYGAAYLLALDSLTEDARKRSLDRIEAHITRPKDREFLELPRLKDRNGGGPTVNRKDESVTSDLPFANPARRE
ncbi:MAG: hypothetical protein V2I43_15740 [Parvularcula sp.]|jgi:hypothetical protein|nr:hypothetical protein [Parvularcula sp.]